jgi:uncharacterized protein YcbX
VAETRIGIVRELWRYTVKSMGGEPLPRALRLHVAARHVLRRRADPPAHDRVARRHFRPNVLVETDPDVAGARRSRVGGRAIRVGETTLRDGAVGDPVVLV